MKTTNEEKKMEAVHLHIAEQHEWLRRHAFDTRKSMTEIIREAIDLYKHMTEAEEDSR